MKRTQLHSTYIWQRDDWPNFRWNSEELIEPLSRLNLLQGRLSGRMSMLGVPEKQKITLSSLTAELINSSEIEGVTLNPQSVRSSIARRIGIDQDGISREDHYVEGLVDVMMDAIKNNSEPLSADRMFGWHSALFPLGRSGMYHIKVGGWRLGDEPMQVVSGAFGHEKVHYEAPPSSSVPDEMAAFIEWVNNTKMSPFIKSAIVHLWFVTVHPFDDGNGRIARILTDMILPDFEQNPGRYYSMSAEINRNKRSYYTALEQAQKGELDITQWLLWFFSCIEDAITRSLEIIETTVRKAAYWENHSKEDINERQRKILNKLWDGFEGKLTTSKWAKICSCSQDTALRDITDLINKGMLRVSEEGGRSTHYFVP